MGVEVQLNAMVTDVDRNGITVKDADGTIRRIESACKVWSAGVSASPLGRDLAEQSETEIDRAGRVKVNPDLSIPGHPNVFVVGDMAFVEGVPGMAQGAIQGGKYVAKIIQNEVAADKHGTTPKPREPFKYFDKGSMATVSKYNAVAQIPLGSSKKLEFGGFFAWLAWLGLHLIYLVGFKTKVATLLSWAVTFLSRERGQLTITEQQAYARTRIEQLEDIAAAVKETERAAS
jgi:NADH dehydrogenase